jgi:methylglutaconyl-CoA hydratase
MGGGTGVAAIADIAIALQDAVFGFTEVRLGLVPSLIAPYVLAKIGESAARELFLTGARFDANRALQIGLVHRVAATADELDRAVQENVDHVLASGSDAIAHAKQLIRQIANRPARDVAQLTIETIAARRASPEARARMAAFLQKRS